MQKIFLVAGLLMSGLVIYAQDYKNPKPPVEKRVADMLGCMTLEEKVAQLRVCEDAFFVASFIRDDNQIRSRGYFLLLHYHCQFFRKYHERP